MSYGSYGISGGERISSNVADRRDRSTDYNYLAETFALMPPARRAAILQPLLAQLDLLGLAPVNPITEPYTKQVFACLNPRCVAHKPGHHLLLTPHQAAVRGCRLCRSRTLSRQAMAKRAEDAGWRMLSRWLPDDSNYRPLLQCTRCGIVSRVNRRYVATACKCQK